MQIFGQSHSATCWQQEMKCFTLASVAHRKMNIITWNLDWNGLKTLMKLCDKNGEFSPERLRAAARPSLMFRREHSKCYNLTDLCPIRITFQVLDKIDEMNRLMYQYPTLVIAPPTGDQNDIFSHFHEFLSSDGPDLHETAQWWSQDFHDACMAGLWILVKRCGRGGASFAVKYAAVFQAQGMHENSPNFAQTSREIRSLYPCDICLRAWQIGFIAPPRKFQRSSPRRPFDIDSPNLGGLFRGSRPTKKSLGVIS